jgi:hypothetical protein
LKQMQQRSRVYDVRAGKAACGRAVTVAVHSNMKISFNDSRAHTMSDFINAIAVAIK